jgi:hypothetical protein
VRLNVAPPAGRSLFADSDGCSITSSARAKTIDGTSTLLVKFCFVWWFF